MDHQKQSQQTTLSASHRAGADRNPHAWQPPAPRAGTEAEQSNTSAKGKVIIVTGASRGMGLCVTRELLRLGHRVCLISRTDADDVYSKLEMQHPNEVRWMLGDLAEEQTAAKIKSLAIMAFGRIDGLVVNHGVLEPLGTVDNCPVDKVKKLFDINLFGAYNIVQVALPEIRRSKGAVVFNSSGAATNAYQGWVAYGMSKAALNSLGAHLGNEERDITSVCIAPGRVDTDMQKTLREKGEGTMDPNVYKDFVDAYGTNRLVKPELPANVIARLVAYPDISLSGKFLKWNAKELSMYQEPE